MSQEGVFFDDSREKQRMAHHCAHTILEEGFPFKESMQKLTKVDTIKDLEIAGFRAFCETWTVQKQTISLATA